MEIFRSNTAGVVAGGGRVGTNRTPGPTPEEAAAMVVAIEQFVRDTVPAAAPEPAAARDPAAAPEPALSPWKREALLESVSGWPDATASAF
jgi:hypothetical protein